MYAEVSLLLRVACLTGFRGPISCRIRTKPASSLIPSNGTISTDEFLLKAVPETCLGYEAAS